MDGRSTDLGDVADELADCEDRTAVYWTTTEGVRALLGTAVVVVYAVDDGAVYPRATAADGLHVADYLDADAGLAGETLREGARVVDDLRSHPAVDDRRAGPFRSALSVPVAESLGLQALSTERGAFSATDEATVGVVATQARTALARIDSQRRLQRERDRFAALFENLPDPAVEYRTTADGVRTEAVNSAFVRTFGCDPEAAVGTPPADLVAAGDPPDPDPSGARGGASPTGAAPDADGDDSAPGATASEAGVPAESELVAADPGDQREVSRETTDGRRRFLLRNIPVDARDDRRGYLIYTDVEETRRREEALRRQNDRLEEFASVVSHDLRNPLGAARGYLEVGRETGEQRHFEEVETAIDRAERIVDDVLAMAREGQTVVDAEVVDLAVVARTAWNTVPTEGASLSVVDPPSVEADRSRLTQLLENLFRNAVEHGSTGRESDADSEAGVTVRVGRLGSDGGDGDSGDGDRSSPSPEGFYVADDGPGIDPERREAVFEAGTSDDGGTGLGLSVVRSIADAHGWTVTLTDSETGGLRVEVET